MKRRGGTGEIMACLAFRFRNNGFTIIELVVVLIVLGILAVVAIAKLTGTDSFRVQGFFDSAQATVRFAQKTAISQRTLVFVVLNTAAGTISVCYTNATCANPVIDPTTAQGMVAVAPTGVTLAGPATFSFNGLGQPSAAATITVTGAGMSTSFFVESETGYVHP
jgi:MSHA pilin protein MshC